MCIRDSPICLENKGRDVITYKCGHTTCINCYILKYYPIFDVYSYSECPVCKTISRNFDLRYTTRLEKCKYYETSDEVFKSIFKYLKTVKNNQNTKGIVDSILILYNSFRESSTKFPILLSKDQTEILLTIVKERNMNEWDDGGYRFYNLLVSMCYEPWKIDGKLGSHGICYHGNFGEYPGLFVGLNLIQRNLVTLSLIHISEPTRPY